MRADTNIDMWDGKGGTMDRRKFIQATAFSGAAIATAGVAQAAHRVLRPMRTMAGPQMVEQVFVQRPQRLTQQCPEWCWAASCAMIFSMWGHPTDQKEIVQRVYGSLVCGPARNAMTMAQVLSDTWTDMRGGTFRSHLTAAYDAQFNVNTFNSAIVVNELFNNRPLLYANTHHAMVVVTADYINTRMGPNILRVGVLDPWPLNPAYHVLSPAEIVPAQQRGQMMFLASVRI